MSVFKHLIARGAYYLEKGTHNVESWSKHMIDDLGPNVEPYLEEILHWSLMLVGKETSEQFHKLNLNASED